jgi:hypothetical protein
MYRISWPLWVTLVVIIAGLLAIAISVTPFSPLVRYVRKVARGQARAIWALPVLTTVVGVVLVLLGLLFRPW